MYSHFLKYTWGGGWDFSMSIWNSVWQFGRGHFLAHTIKVDLTEDMRFKDQGDEGIQLQ